jgi:SRSO17 transposase
VWIVPCRFGLVAPAAGLPIAYRLYLPREWAADANRRIQAGVLEDVFFQTKPQIAVEQLHAAVSAGSKAEVVLADAGCDTHTAFYDSITEMDLPYVLGIQSSISLWPPGQESLPPSNGVSAVGRHPRSAATPKTSLSRPNKSRRTFPRRRGGDSLGGKTATPSSPRDLPMSVSARRIAIITARHCALRNGA